MLIRFCLTACLAGACLLTNASAQAPTCVKAGPQQMTTVLKCESAPVEPVRITMPDHGVKVVLRGDSATDLCAAGSEDGSPARCWLDGKLYEGDAAIREAFDRRYETIAHAGGVALPGDCPGPDCDRNSNDQAIQYDQSLQGYLMVAFTKEPSATLLADVHPDFQKSMFWKDEHGAMRPLRELPAVALVEAAREHLAACHPLPQLTVNAVATIGPPSSYLRKRADEMERCEKAEARLREMVQ